MAVLLLAFGLAMPAQAQPGDDEALLHRLAGLEHKVQTLNRTLDPEVVRGNAEPRVQLAQARDLPDTYAAQVEIRLAQLERQLQLLTGRIEELQFQTRQNSQRLDRALSDIEFRLNALEGGSPQAGAPAEAPGAAQAATPAPAVGTLGTLTARPGQNDRQVAAAAVALPPGDVTQQYDYAYGFLQQADYERAEEALRLFLAEHQDHPLASNAQYWLGETFYVRSRYNDAAVAFAQGYQQFPSGPKAMDSLLKLGMSLGAMGQTQDACLTFSQLSNLFPDAPTAIMRRAQIERDRLQCP